MLSREGMPTKVCVSYCLITAVEATRLLLLCNELVLVYFLHNSCLGLYDAYPATVRFFHVAANPQLTILCCWRICMLLYTISASHFSSHASPALSINFVWATLKWTASIFYLIFRPWHNPENIEWTQLACYIGPAGISRRGRTARVRSWLLIDL